MMTSVRALNVILKTTSLEVVAIILVEGAVAPEAVEARVEVVVAMTMITLEIGLKPNSAFRFRRRPRSRTSGSTSQGELGN